jgi:hypothetical protein
MYVSILLILVKEYNVSLCRFQRVLTSAYNTLKYWVLGFCPPCGILRDTTFLKLDLFPSSGEGGPTLLGPLAGANLNHSRPSFRNVSVLSIVFIIPEDGHRPVSK